MTEPAWYLCSIPYGEYRQTVWWRTRRDAFRKGHRTGICDCCGYSREGDLPGGWSIRFNVHHVTYERLGQEDDHDLRLVCSPCHNLIHFPQSSAARHWVEATKEVCPDLDDRAAALRPTSSEVVAA